MSVRRRSGIGIFRLMGRQRPDIHQTPRHLRAVPLATICRRCRCHRARPLAAAILVGLVLGCAADAEPDEADQRPLPASDVATDSAPAGQVAGPAADAAVPIDERGDPGVVEGASWTTADTNVERPFSGAALLRDLRTARHDGFDRIVLDFGADEVPGYRVAYVDRPVRQCGSGDVVPLEGDAWLSITVEPANAHTEEGEPTIRERERTLRLPALRELKLICDFEAVVEVVAGVASPERYRVFVLEAPNRVVIDVAW
jgi:hypothetical protein